MQSIASHEVIIAVIVLIELKNTIMSAAATE